MNISSILVATSQSHFATTIDALSAIDGIEVHFCDVDSSRIIVTQEAQNTTHEVEGLQHIKSLPHVMMAEMIYHYCEDNTE